jgi:hypothetical protein
MDREPSGRPAGRQLRSAIDRWLRRALTRRF